MHVMNSGIVIYYLYDNAYIREASKLRAEGLTGKEAGLTTTTLQNSRQKLCNDLIVYSILKIAILRGS